MIAEGAIGGTAQAVGGPFSKDGAIGKQFTTQGTIGGTAQDKLGDDSIAQKASDALLGADGKLDKNGSIGKQFRSTYKDLLPPFVNETD